MAAASLVLVIKTGTSQPSLLVQKDGNSNREFCQDMQNYFSALAAGNQAASVDAYTSTTAPVAATGTITLTYASIANNDTVTIAGVVYTCVTGTPSGAQFKKVTDGPTTATNLAAAINADATLSTFMVAKAVGGVVTCTCLQKGVIGNAITFATSNAPGFALSGSGIFTGGTGGVSAAATTFGLGV